MKRRINPKIKPLVAIFLFLCECVLGLSYSKIPAIGMKAWGFPFTYRSVFCGGVISVTP